MHDPYLVLGVAPGTADEEIKAAFRRLSKQWHPDLHPGDANAGRRFREVISAYKTLSDPKSRLAYDARVANHRSERRRRFRTKAATTATAFALTVCSVSAGVLWQDIVEALLPRNDPRSAVANAPPTATLGRTEEVASLPPEGPTPAAVESSGPVASKSAEGEPSPARVPTPDQSSGGKPVIQPLPEHEAINLQPLPSAEMASTVNPPGSSDDAGKGVLPTERPATVQNSDEGRQQRPPPSSRARGWGSYRDANFGFSLQYPRDVFVSDPAQSDEDKTFLSRDGRARLVISAAVNTSGMTLIAHRRWLMEGAYKGAVFDYSPQRGHWFVLSGTFANDMFYHRVTFSCDRRAVHAWKLVYPVAERMFYDRIVEEVHRRYSHGAAGRCEEVRRQTPKVLGPQD
jgi:DnaJ domain